MYGSKEISFLFIVHWSRFMDYMISCSRKVRICMKQLCICIRNPKNVIASKVANFTKIAKSTKYCEILVFYKDLFADTVHLIHTTL